MSPFVIAQGIVTLRRMVEQFADESPAVHVQKTEEESDGKDAHEGTEKPFPFLGQGMAARLERGRKWWRWWCPGAVRAGPVSLWLPR